MPRLFRSPNLIVIVFIVTGLFFRFYNLNWGAPYFFHPDERNIASSVNQLRFLNQMNPNFFAYGSLPIYTIYLTGLFINTFHDFQIPFDQAILISRFYSAIFSVLLIPLMFIIGKKMQNEKTGLLAAFFTTASVGFIQFSHFGTFEMWITFYSVLLFFISIILMKQFKLRYFLILGLILGALSAIKISNVILIAIAALIILLSLKINLIAHESLGEKMKKIIKGIVVFMGIIFINLVIFLVTNPYTVIDFNAFINSMNYESGVALGTTAVFYTHEFFNTIPAVFQFVKVYPFLLNPVITIFFIPSFLYILWRSIKYKDKNYFLLITFYLLLFTSQAFLFVKWTRYMIPTLPFVYLIVASAIVDLFKNIKQISSIRYQVLGIICLLCLLFTFSYFFTVLASKDSRITAAKWAGENIDKNANILSESYDLGIIAFNSSFPNIALCDFYNIETSQFACNGFALDKTINDAKYIILPSERLLKMAFIQKDKYPKRYKFYLSLLNDSLKYRLVYKTPCNTFCKITYLNDPLFALEQTTNVFDRPTIYIFQKI